MKNNNNNNQNNTNNNNNNNINALSVTKNETKNATAPILVTSVSKPLTSVLQCNSKNTVSTVNCGTIVKKPSIILLTQASLSKLLSTSDLNMINNNNNNASQNNNTNTNIHNVNANVNHVHSHHQHENSNRSKCSITINTTTNPNPSTVTQNNSQLTSVLMINSTSTIETSAGVVTLTSTSAPNRNLSDDTAKTNNSQASVMANRNLPATPKSITDPHMADTFASVNRSDNENAMENEAGGDDEKTEYEYSEDYDDSESADNQQRFILAPTPAQLGRAPLQRRLGSLVGGDANSEYSTFIRHSFLLYSMLDSMRIHFLHSFVLFN